MHPVTVHMVITDFFSSGQTVNILFFLCLDVESGVALRSPEIHEGAAAMPWLAAKNCFVSASLMQKWLTWGTCNDIKSLFQKHAGRELTRTYC